MAKHIIEMVDVTKVYGDTTVLNGINLYIRQNEFLTLLGPSGCGKTTSLRLIGGFEQLTSGRILFDGKDISSLPPYKRNLNTVFQKYALFTHMNVYENIAFGLRIKKTPEAEVKKAVKDVLHLVNLDGYEKRDTDSLSGGQQQRIAIARALVNRPEVLLLDEPLGALDLKMRQDMQLELKSMQRQLGITFIYVTHDQEEALTMSDTVVVMRNGEIQQIGTPQDIYNEPENSFVADFIGESNIIDGIMLEDYRVRFSGCDFKCVDSGFGRNAEIDVVVRPEDVKVVSPEQGMLTGEVSSQIFLGVHYEITVIVSGETGSTPWIIHSTSAAKNGDKVGLVLYPEDIHIMNKSPRDWMERDLEKQLLERQSSEQ